jgi:hypothetical protein
MAKPFSGSELVGLLIEELGCHNKAQVARRLNVKPAQIQSWENGKLTKLVARNVIRKVKASAVNRAIAPIIEFHQLNHLHGKKTDTLRKKIDNKSVCDELKLKKGIYTFYDSNGRIIYVGKTEKNNLLSEMDQAFKLKRNKYLRKLVNKKGDFKSHSLTLRDTAEFVSAYEVDSDVIGNIEAFLTRIIPNDVVNQKTERFKH